MSVEVYSRTPTPAAPSSLERKGHGVEGRTSALGREEKEEKKKKASEKVSASPKDFWSQFGRKRLQEELYESVPDVLQEMFPNVSRSLLLEQYRLNKNNVRQTADYFLRVQYHVASPAIFCRDVIENEEIPIDVLIESVSLSTTTLPTSTWASDGEAKQEHASASQLSYDDDNDKRSPYLQVMPGDLIMLTLEWLDLMSLGKMIRASRECRSRCKQILSRITSYNCSYYYHAYASANEEKLILFINSFPNLHSLSLPRCYFRSWFMFPWLSHKRNITTLNLSHCSAFDDNAAEYINELVFPNLKHLDISYTRVTDYGLEYLSEHISNHIQVIALNGLKGITKFAIRHLMKNRWKSLREIWWKKGSFQYDVSFQNGSSLECLDLACSVNLTRFELAYTDPPRLVCFFFYLFDFILSNMLLLFLPPFEKLKASIESVELPSVDAYQAAITPLDTFECFQLQKLTSTNGERKRKRAEPRKRKKILLLLNAMKLIMLIATFLLRQSITIQKTKELLTESNQLTHLNAANCMRLERVAMICHTLKIIQLNGCRSLNRELLMKEENMICRSLRNNTVESLDMRAINTLEDEDIESILEWRVVSNENQCMLKEFSVESCRQVSVDVIAQIARQFLVPTSKSDKSTFLQLQKQKQKEKLNQLTRLGIHHFNVNAMDCPSHLAVTSISRVEHETEKMMKKLGRKVRKKRQK
ncbi:hypothetical protein RFI_35436 [Reticulomyxa filosa]|uniref:F-box domain-containing protein n=1 Tax=Reticulomyxa filosa TaxID=46433 RepID=X6LLJ1_RETFI|nr:hypothetical protein RFI_35436 [Reticulomyxa filosa]|eukprot:ETO02002.1 hypothetical protein RFI_35436 [Reticulomyxa filosa]